MKKKLRLERDHLKRLTPSELDRVGGGLSEICTTFTWLPTAGCPTFTQPPTRPKTVIVILSNACP